MQHQNQEQENIIKKQYKYDSYLQHWSQYKTTRWNQPMKHSTQIYN
jgi:hypothetical protein